MGKKTRNFCPHCGERLTLKEENGIPRDYCAACRVFYYENPLPVVSSLLVVERKVLLVKRGHKPYRGKWCLPTGFAETGESIEDATLRELEEETGLRGSIVRLVDVHSQSNYFYGDLLFITFEVKEAGGTLSPGDEALAARFFSIERIPRLAFQANTKAVQAYAASQAESWAIYDSFAHSLKAGSPPKKRKILLSDRLLHTVETHAQEIAQNWFMDVTRNKSTVRYHTLNEDHLYHRVHRVLAHFGKWLDGSYDDRRIQKFFVELGRERRREGFPLSEVLSALSLTKKHIWQFALSRKILEGTLEIYAALEFDRRIELFFDRAAFYTARGFEGR